MAPATGRQRIADALGLATILLVLLDLLRPSLLLLPTITAGGDTPCHYPTAVWFHEHLLPSLRLHGWYPGASLGHPLLLYYFPFPFLLMSSLAPLVGMPVAFKLGTALGVFLLPLLVYASFRLMRLAFPAPLLGAGAALVFLYVEDNPIWGGTIASTLTGEFSYTYGVGFAILFLGRPRARPDGRPRAVGPGRGAGAHQLRARLRRAVGGPHRLGSPAVGPREPPTRRGGRRAVAHSRLAAGGRGAGLRLRRPRPRCRSSRTGAGRRPSTTPGST